MRNDKENLIVDLTFQFALAIIEFSEKLENGKKYVIARQLIKSGTSVGANIREAQNVESRDDFIHKLKIAAKKADETKYWLLLCQESRNYPSTVALRSGLMSIVKVLSKIIGSSKKNGNSKSQNHLSPHLQIDQSSNLQINKLAC